ncbi:patatin family protein [Cohnella pontilimi]|uniref:Patatin family protein n=1 Tax=Cohnella pontilimi TaxID=2564100 RepID=A0A4U0FGI7_9BACL|nr:patatin family protein [Cohnella pontilimi]TJY44008.1 patatin family protein [Cohnella pontilimi]
MEPTGLILEGGGMRGLYTAGVLEYFAERDLYFPYQIGVSAGACMAVSYLSRQRGRNKKVNIDFAGDSRYLSWRKLLIRRELFGMDFIFGEIPNKLVPFDFKAFREAEEEMVVGTTDIETGEPLYFSKNKQDPDMLTVLRASSSLPFFAPIVEYEGKKLMDGGISDPIPIRQAEKDGYRRNVLILTRNEGYVKSANRMRWLLRKGYGQYPNFIEVMLRRHEVYNETVAYVEQQAKDGSAFIIRPDLPLRVGRVEQNKTKLEQLYQQGYEEAKKMFPHLLNWLNG